MNKLYLLLILSIIISSCVPLYRPSAALTPTLEEEGQIDIEVNSSRESFDGTFGYSVTDHFGVYTGGTYENRRESRPDLTRITKYAFGAMGYYTEVNPNVGRNNEYLGIYAGYGSGYYQAAGGKYLSYRDETHSRAWANTSFIQLHWYEKVLDRSKKKFIWSFFSVKFQEVNFTRYEALLNTNFGNATWQPLPLNRHTFVDISLGQEYEIFEWGLRFAYQLGATIATRERDLNYEYHPLRLNLGLSYNLQLN